MDDKPSPLDIPRNLKKFYGDFLEAIIESSIPLSKNVNSLSIGDTIACRSSKDTDKTNWKKEIKRRQWIDETNEKPPSDGLYWID